MAATIPDDVLDRLTEGIRGLTNTESWQRWLRVQSKFHRYSFNNSLLIALQCPTATHVAGFGTWLSVGRHVKKGSKSIAILAPMTKRVTVTEADGSEDSRKQLFGFRVARVFDVAATDGAELPPSPAHRLVGAEGAVHLDALTGVAQSIGYTVAWVAAEGFCHDGTNGDCNYTTRVIRVRSDLDPTHQAKTLCHELGHALCHENFNSRPLAELEAESIAFVVLDALGIASDDYSFAYVASWAGGGDQAIAAIRESGSRIARAARQILDGADARVMEGAA
jgi:antirestriction protein ArdC